MIAFQTPSEILSLEQILKYTIYLNLRLVQGEGTSGDCCKSTTLHTKYVDGTEQKGITKIPEKRNQSNYFNRIKTSVVNFINY